MEPKDPMERMIYDALIKAGIPFVTDHNGKNLSGLDFLLTDLGIEIEVKQFHSPRIADQMTKAENVIVAQGEKAVELLAFALTKLGSCDPQKGKR